MGVSGMQFLFRYLTFLVDGLVTLPKGTFLMLGKHKLHGAIAGRLKLRSTSTLTGAAGIPQMVPASTAALLDVSGRISVSAATETFDLVVVLSGTPDALTLGEAANIAGEAEVFGELVIQQLS